jgi:hypothetical protein
MIKMIGWRLVLHKEGLALYWSFSYAVGVQCPQSYSQWEARAEEISLTLLTNKKQEKLVRVYTANIFRPISFRVNRKKYGNCSVNSEEHLKNLKTRPDAYLGLYSSKNIIKAQSIS